MSPFTHVSVSDIQQISKLPEQFTLALLFSHPFVIQLGIA